MGSSKTVRKRTKPKYPPQKVWYLLLTPNLFHRAK